MKMKTLVPFLVIAVTFYFDPATSNAIKEDKNGTEQGSDPVPSCLQQAMVENYKAVDAVIKFLCSYMTHKDTVNKELIKAMENLMNVTGCSAEDLFGSDASLEQVALDENGVLTSQILAMKQLLTSHVLMPINEAVCAFVDLIEKSSDFIIQSSKGEVQGHKRTTRDLLSLVGGLGGTLDGIGGLLSLLGLVGKLAKVLEPVIVLVGSLLDGLSGVTGILGGVTGGLLGGGQKQGDLLGGLLGGVGGTLGGLTGGLGGLTGGLTGGLLGGGNGGSNLLGGLLGR